MRTFKVTFVLQLEDDDTDFIERAIEENLEGDEQIIDGNIEEVL